MTTKMNRFRNIEETAKIKKYFFFTMLFIFTFDFVTTILAHGHDTYELNPIIRFLFTINGISYLLIYFIVLTIFLIVFLDVMIKASIKINNKFNKRNKINRINKINIYKIVFFTFAIVGIIVDLLAVFNNMIAINQSICATKCVICSLK